MNIEVITSFDQNYYDNIGHACVKSWLEYWPHDLVLNCYVEDMAMSQHNRIRQIPFTALGTDYELFQASNEGHRTKTFAKKAYSIIHAMTHTKADRLYWIDADVITKQTVPMAFLADLCKPNKLAAFMGVQHDQYFSAETGVFVLNPKHTMFSLFVKRYSDRYNNHVKDDLRRFYDGEVFGAVAKEFESDVIDICHGLGKPYKTPLRHTELGKYFHHHKSKHAKQDFVAQAQ